MSDIRAKKVSNPGDNIPGGGMAPSEKSKDLRKAYSRIFGYLGKFKGMGSIFSVFLPKSTERK